MFVFIQSSMKRINNSLLVRTHAQTMRAYVNVFLFPPCAKGVKQIRTDITRMSLNGQIRRDLQFVCGWRSFDCATRILKYPRFPGTLYFLTYRNGYFYTADYNILKGVLLLRLVSKRFKGLTIRYLDLLICVLKFTKV